MKLQQRLSQVQTQKLSQKLSTKMIQMFKVFGQSYSDLLQSVRQESQENVTLEIEHHDQLLNYASNQRKSNSDPLLDKDLSDYAADDHSQSLIEFCMGQLKLTNCDEEKTNIATELISNLDDRGFLENYRELRDQLCTQFNVAPRTVNGVLNIIQSFEPDGVGARSLKECLLLQIEHMELEEELTEILTKVIKHHIDHLTAEKYELIADALSIEVDGVKAVHDYIKQNCNPNPGSSFSSDRFDQFIIPSFEVSIAEDGHLVIKNLESEYGIKARLSPNYQKLIQSPDTDAETRQFLKEKEAKAKALLDNIHKRRDSLNRLAQYIFEQQHLYLKKGLDYLIPLMQKDISQTLDINPSTVSRILSTKFCRSPQGLVPLKTFCPRSHFGKTITQLKKIIHETIQEFPTYSDQKLSDILTERHLPMKRRTVTKYRHLLGLPTRSKPSLDSKSSNF